MKNHDNASVSTIAFFAMIWARIARLIHRVKDRHERRRYAALLHKRERFSRKLFELPAEPRRRRFDEGAALATLISGLLIPILVYVNGWSPSLATFVGIGEGILAGWAFSCWLKGRDISRPYRLSERYDELNQAISACWQKMARSGRSVKGYPTA